MASLLLIQLKARCNEALSAAQLRESHEALEIFSRERERLSRDLHDGTIQSIYAIGLGLKRCERLIEPNPALARSQLAASISDINVTIADLRQFVLSLEQHLPRGETLDTALRSLVDRLRRTMNVGILLKLEPTLCETMEPRHSIHLLNIVREAVSNSVRHGQASQIEINLLLSGQLCSLQITDNGTGFVPRPVSGDGKGLRNMAARAQELNGTFQIQSQPGRGAQIYIEIPT